MQSLGPSAPPPPSFRAVSRAVVVSQLLFTAGHVLTTGAFLTYYAYELHPSPLQLSVFLILPELAETFGFLARPLSRRIGSRKRSWIATLVGARLLALGVPLTALPVLLSGTPWRFEVLSAWVAGWYVLQGMAYACYLSWLSDLMPETNWGSLFARWKMASLAVMIVVPVIAGMARTEWANHLPPDQKLITYAVVFLCGNLLVVLAVAPMLRVPDLDVQQGERRDDSRPQATVNVIREALADPAFRWILLHGWWLSFAQGLTQTALVSYQIGVLKIPVETYYVMSGTMYALQLPLTALAGKLSDRGWDKPVLFWSVTAVSGAMLFVLAATPEQWWLLFGAYIVWGLFGFVNLCGNNLMLKLAPRTDNTAHVSLFRQMGGLCAALSGVLGGIWLDRLTRHGTSLSLAGYVLGPFQIVFLASFVGRLTAGLWVLPIRTEPATATVDQIGSAPVSKGK